jgi:hypothetical protein
MVDRPNQKDHPAFDGFDGFVINIKKRRDR